MTIPGMKQRLRSGEILAGYFNLIPFAVSAQAMAAAGADWIIIDQEHGPVGLTGRRDHAVNGSGNPARKNPAGPNPRGSRTHVGAAIR